MRVTTLLLISLASSGVAQPPAMTVPDLIGMTTIGSRQRGDFCDCDYDVPSPDGGHIATVVKRGNLERNTVDYALLVFRAADLFHSPKPDTVLELATSSNRPAISQVAWESDNATVLVLGERPNETSQVYAVDIRTHRLTTLTHAATVITSFHKAAIGDLLVYTAESAPDTSAYATMRAHGFVLSPRQTVYDVIAGAWAMPSPSWDGRNPKAFTVVRGGTTRTIPLPDSTTGYHDCLTEKLTVSPTGDMAILWCKPVVAPTSWSGYRLADFRQNSDRGFVYYMNVLVDLTTGAVRPLLAAPASFESSVAWSPDGRAVAVANAMLPLEGADATERDLRATRRALVEVDARTGQVTVIAPRDSMNVIAWDARSNRLEVQPKQWPDSRDTTRIYYKKTAKGWTSLSDRSTARDAAPTLLMDQGMNTPPRLVAVDPRTHERRVLYDPTPDLTRTRWLAHEDIVHWKTKAGAPWIAGLYWPAGYVKGRRYPLVIQTHGFDSTSFWPDGIFSTGEAAQPLAGLGVMILQLSDLRVEADLATSREGPLMQAGIESAIDHLDSLGLIDRNHIGIQGFSRTCYYTLYFLSHSTYPIAAASITDGVDESYIQYLVWGPLRIGQGDGSEEETINDGRPWGKAFATWGQRAPGFNVDHITAPLRLTALNPAGLLEEWEPYAGLLMQGKPAEMVLIPDGNHILFRPWDRLTSQQGAVDWFRFWLQAAEDSDPAKADQYDRWRVLRRQQASVSTP